MPESPPLRVNARVDLSPQSSCSGDETGTSLDHGKQMSALPIYLKKPPARLFGLPWFAVNIGVASSASFVKTMTGLLKR